MGNSAPSTGKASSSSSSSKNVRKLPGQVTRVEYWTAPYSYKSGNFAPEETTLAVYDKKELLGTKHRSFLLVANNKEQYFTVGFLNGAIDFKELSRTDRIQLRIKKTEGYQVIRVVTGAQHIKPYLTTDQVLGWAKQIERSGFESKGGTKSDKKRVDVHSFALILFNRIVLTNDKHLTKYKKSLFG
mmetsp:Transcript_45491/g.73156  ORF Transcript_45491/g.73156 Transcript_45491/m.73156 type:complete len:186 (-) Transcript_45491:627-1184(-)